MKIFYGIDGTCNNDPSPEAVQCDTQTAMKLSPNRHVKRVMRFGFAKQQYVEGTFDVAMGQSSAGKIKDAVVWLKQAYQTAASQQAPQIYLSGFSRGGASVLCVGHELEKLGIPVRAMYIFDAVDRSNVMPNNQTSHPSKNVQEAFHAFRDPAAGSRRSFSFCGRENRFNNLKKEPIMSTHGGVGGWPYGNDSLSTGALRGVGNYPGSLLVAGFNAMIDRGHTGHIHEEAELQPTNLTPKQEEMGMLKAWDWMSKNIANSMR